MRFAIEKYKRGDKMIFNIIILFILSLIISITKYSSPIEILISFFIVFIPFTFIMKKQKNAKLSTKTIFLKLLYTLILLIVCSINLFTNFNSKEIYIKNNSNKNILINSIYVDSNKIELNNRYNKKDDLVNDATFITEYKEQNKNTSKYKMVLYPYEKYVLKIDKKKTINIELQRKEKDYEVNINNKKIVVKKLNYKDSNNKVYKMSNYNYKYNYNNSTVNILNIKSIFVLLLTGYLFFILINLNREDKKKNLLFLLPIIIELNPIGNINLITKLFIVIIISIIYRKSETLVEENTKTNNIILILSSLLISFSFLGKYLIDQLNIIIFMFYLLLTMYIYILLPYIYSIINKLNIVRKKQNIDKIKYHRILIFSFTTIILIIYKMLFSPFIILTDGYMEMSNVLNNILTDWHPYLHTLFIKLFYSIFNNFDSFIFFRIIIYSLVLNKITFYFYEKGLKLSYIYILSVLITINPIVGTGMVTLLKDTDFVLAFITLIFYLYLISNEYEIFSKSKINYIVLILSLIGVAFFRHNGLYVSIIITILLLISSIKNKRKLLIISLLVFIIISFIIENPLYKKLNVESAPRNFDVATIIHGFGYIMKYDKDKIDNNTYKYLTENIMSEKDFKLYYDKYNIDIMLHYNSEDENKKIRNIKINKQKLITMYLKQVIKTPSLLIKDRLYGTDIMWNVVEDDKINITKTQFMYDEFDNNFAKDLSMENTQSKSINKITTYISNNDLLNILFYRIGIYLDTLLILLSYNYINKKGKLVLIAFPIGIYLFTFLLTLQFQSFRYVWIIPVFTYLYMLITIFSTSKGQRSKK